MVQQLQQTVGAHLIEPVERRDATVDRGLARLSGTVTGTSYLPAWGRATATRRSREVARRISALSPALSALTAIAATPDLLAVPRSLPLIQVTDGSFRHLCRTYPSFARLSRITVVQALGIESAVAARTDCFLVASTSGADALMADVRVPAGRIEVVPFGPGVSPPDGSGCAVEAPTSGLQVLFVASDWQRKQGDLALRTVERARAGDPTIGLTVVGEIPRPLPGWVETPGRVEPAELSALYHRSDVLLEPTSASAGGVVVTDALTHGLPVIGTDVGGLRDLIHDDVTGWRIATAEFEKVAAQRLLEVAAESHEARRSRRERARHWADAHASWDTWGETLESILRERGLAGTS